MRQYFDGGKHEDAGTRATNKIATRHSHRNNIFCHCRYIATVEILIHFHQKYKQSQIVSAAFIYSNLYFYLSALIDRSHMYRRVTSHRIIMAMINKWTDHGDRSHYCRDIQINIQPKSQLSIQPKSQLNIQIEWRDFTLRIYWENW